MKVKLQKPYLLNFNLLVVQDLWKARYLILLISLQKEIIKLNVNISIIGKKCVTCGISYKDYECCLEFTNIAII